jgi:hypothetical protein
MSKKETPISISSSQIDIIRDEYALPWDECPHTSFPHPPRTLIGWMVLLYGYMLALVQDAHLLCSGHYLLPYPYTRTLPRVVGQTGTHAVRRHRAKGNWWWACQGCRAVYCPIIRSNSENILRWGSRRVGGLLRSQFTGIKLEIKESMFMRGLTIRRTQLCYG